MALSLKVPDEHLHTTLKKGLGVTVLNKVLSGKIPFKFSYVLQVYRRFNGK